jgi:acyl-CoA synthetase (AMP-forming)/AMP-acid ligase II
MTARQIEGTFRTVDEVLRAGAQVNGDIEAFVEPSTPSSPRNARTFAQWDRAADGVAGLFAACGVTRGSLVCLILPSSYDYMVCFAAAVRLGAITSGVNTRLGSVEVQSILGRTRPTVTVVDDGTRALASAHGLRLTRSDVVRAFDGPKADAGPQLQSTDPVAVVWTSGTTGLPKGAVFDHRSLAAVAHGSDTLSAPGDRRLSPLPFAHVGSMTRVWDEIINGITTVITPTPWRASEAIAVMETERITVAQGVPTQWALVMAHPDLASADLSSLRVAGTGASRMLAELIAEMRDRLGVPVVVRYTSTEASLGTATVPGDADQVVANTVGRAVAGVSVTIADDEGLPVASGEVGRVRLRSAAVMLGYWGGPAIGPGVDGVVYDTELTGSVVDADGWLTTGDFGFQDESGNLHLVGRVNELYIRGGYNVYPAEVESVLSSHPALSQVAVVGVPDPVLGEIGVAFVVADHGAVADGGADAAHVSSNWWSAELRRFAGDTLADYKAPDRVIVADELPMTSMMKVDRRVLAERAIEQVTSFDDGQLARSRNTESRAS